MVIIFTYDVVNNSDIYKYNLCIYRATYATENCINLWMLPRFITNCKVGVTYGFFILGYTLCSTSVSVFIRTVSTMNISFLVPRLSLDLELFSRRLVYLNVILCV